MGNNSVKMIRPYGGILDDGKIQVSFTLPCKLNESSRKVALQVAKSMGLKDSLIVHEKQLSEDFTFFIVYGCLLKTFPLIPIKEKTVFSIDEIKGALRQLEKPIVVVGATTGTDAHTVGLDAIMNMKGIKGHKGLESYPNIVCINMGAQISNRELLDKAVEVNADFVLVSQTVTQNNCHLNNLRELKSLLDTEYPQYLDKVYIGGARITNDLAVEEGFVRGFGANSLPEDTIMSMLIDLGILKEGEDILLQVC